MIGLFLGAAALGAFAFSRHHRRCHGYGRWGGPPWAHGPWAGPPWAQGDVPPWDQPHGGHHRRGWRGRHGFGKRAMLYGLFSHLDATPGQEKLIRDELDKLVELGKEQRGRWKDSRRNVADLLRADSLDPIALGALLDGHQDGLDALRAAAVGALGRIHAALDERQRARLADLLAEGPGRGFGRGGFGPYR